MPQELLRTKLPLEPPSAATPLRYHATSEQKRNYRIILQKDEDGRFVATCPDLPGVVTDGSDEREAMENARYAVSDMLDSLGDSNEEFNLSLMFISLNVEDARSY